jgi:hypothetical protein
MFMLYRHLKPIEEKNYHRRLPDMVWQFFWSAAAIMVSASMMAESLTKTRVADIMLSTSLSLLLDANARLYRLSFVPASPQRVDIIIRTFYPEVCSVQHYFHYFISYLRTSSVQWFPYVLVAFDMAMSPLIGCGTIAGLLVAQVLYMLEYESPSEGNPMAEPTLKPHSILRAPDWLTRLLVEPQAQARPETVRAVYGNATAPGGRGLRDGGRGANTTTTTTGYQWGRGHRLGEE